MELKETCRKNIQGKRKEGVLFKNKKGRKHEKDKR
jgi:hypothetical protein